MPDPQVNQVDAKEAREKAVRDAKGGIILDASLRIFAEKGFHATRLEDIAAAAGFSKAALYNYYDSKEAIFLNLAVRENDRLLATLEQKLSPRLSVAENLREAFGAVFGIFGEHFGLVLEISDFRSLSQFGMAAFAKEHERLMGELVQRVARLNGMLAGILAAARQRGELTSNLSDEAIVRYITAQIRGALLEWRMRGSMGDIDAEVTQVLDFVLHGVGEKQ